VTAAGIGQLIWIAAACARLDIMIRLPRPRLTPGVRRLLALMVPGLIGAGVVQINLVVDVILASTLLEGSVSFLYFADRINQLPLGVVGVAVGVALLPLLTRQLADGDEAAASDSQNRAIEFALVLTLPAAVALMTIAGPLVSVLFERGAFDAAAAANTAAALTAFAVGLPAYVLIKALTPGFFARQDTATPVKVGIFAMVLNVVLAVTLMQVMAHVGIALATACSAWINALALGFILHRRNQLRIDPRLRRNAPRALAAAIFMAVPLIFAKAVLEPYFGGSSFEKIMALCGLVVLGLGVYALVAHLFGAVRVSELRSMLRRPPST
jgi:putative peptidoglycan lipid II flippase